MSASLPVHLVTGLEPEVMAGTTISLQWDLPGAVVVQHRIDPDTRQLVRVVSDISGRLEEEVVDLEHACVSCAVREDMVPTLDRLADLGRWSSIVAHLAPGTEASQVCRVLGWQPERHEVRVASVLAAFDAADLGEVLLGDASLEETTVPTLPDDDRGLAEVAVPILEYADLIVLDGSGDTGAPVDPVGRDAARALARPGALILGASGDIDARILQQGIHHHPTTEAWVDEVRRGEVPCHDTEQVWTLDLRSERPLHPGRLNERFEDLGVGTHRARGCLWLASRPGDVVGWDGAGGHHRLGAVATWDPAGTGAENGPLSRVVVTGRRDDDNRETIRRAFEDCLVTDRELARDVASTWSSGAGEDGLEPWLGPIRATR